MKQLDRLLSAALSVLLLVVLSACGAGGGDGGGGSDGGDEQQPPTLAYEIDLVGELPEWAVGPNAELSFWYWTEMSERGGHIERLEPLDVVGPTSTVSVTIDARDLADVSLQGFVDWYWGQDELTVSDPDHEIKVFDAGYLLQRPASGSGSLYSHELWPVHQYSSDGFGRSSLGYLVFSDQEASISGAGDGWLFEVTLHPGWNLFYSEYRPDAEGAENYYGAELAAQPSELLTSDSSIAAAYGVLSEEFGGVAAFLAPSPSGAVGSPNIFAGYSSGRTLNIFLFLPSWLEDPHLGVNLLALPEAIGSAGGAAESSDPDARFGMATILAFDVANTENSAWWADAALSSGEVQALTENGNRVIFLYADRNTTLHLSGTELAALPGSAVSTLAQGVDLYMGWNRIEIEEIVPGGTFLAHRHASIPRQLQVVK